ncbi:hypothetical protein DIPPA_06546 [Diplonema papillatum]|nr:hypothetical protein DIPPA_06546 [Diplonema papillatum]
MFKHGHHGHGHGHGQPAAGARILFASYGGLDITQKVQHMFNTHHNVHIGPAEYVRHFGDPAPGEFKDFVVLAVDGANKCFCHIAADNQPTNISMGAQNSSPRTAPAHGSEILAANYGGVDVTAQCRDMFNHKGSLQFDRSLNDMFGDTLPGVAKVLAVVFKTTKGPTPHRAGTYWSEAEKPNLTRDGHQARGMPGHHHHQHQHCPQPTPVFHHPMPHQPAHNSRGMPGHHHHHHQAPPPTTGPRVLFASYGGSDVTHHVQGMYNSHRGKLSIAGGQYTTHFSDPFPGQLKDFVVMTVDNGNNSQVHVAAENSPTHIDGSAAQHSTPHHGPPPHASEIIQANYGGADVTAKCKELFNRRHGLRFDRSMNDTFGDPLPGVSKRLAIIYMTKSGNIPHRACAHYGESDKPHIPHQH